MEVSRLCAVQLPGQGRDEEVAAQGSEECSPTAAPGAAASRLWPREPAEDGAPGPVACRRQGCYSGPGAVAGSYGDRVEVMCPDHIIGVD